MPDTAKLSTLRFKAPFISRFSNMPIIELQAQVIAYALCNYSVPSSYAPERYANKHALPMPGFFNYLKADINKDWLKPLNDSWSSSETFSTKDRKPSARDLPCGRSHKNVQHGICCFSGC